MAAEYNISETKLADAAQCEYQKFLEMKKSKIAVKKLILKNMLSMQSELQDPRALAVIVKLNLNPSKIEDQFIFTYQQSFYRQNVNHIDDQMLICSNGFSAVKADADDKLQRAIQACIPPKF